MYARYFTFSSTPDKRPTIEALADGIYAFTRAQPGFVSATYLVSVDQAQYGSLTLWESQAAAQAAGETIRAAIGDKLDGVATAPPDVAIMEVYEPKEG